MEEEVRETQSTSSTGHTTTSMRIKQCPQEGVGVAVGADSCKEMGTSFSALQEVDLPAT